MELEVKPNASFSETFNVDMVRLGLIYAEHYKRNGKVFVGMFLKFNSVRSGSEMVVRCSKKIGVFDEAKETGQDFSGYAAKFNLTDYWKQVLADILLIIYYMNYETKS